MSADEAEEYGLVDQVVSRRKVETLSGDSGDGKSIRGAAKSRNGSGK